MLGGLVNYLETLKVGAYAAVIAAILLVFVIIGIVFILALVNDVKNKVAAIPVPPPEGGNSVRPLDSRRPVSGSELPARRAGQY